MNIFHPTRTHLAGALLSLSVSVFAWVDCLAAPAPTDSTFVPDAVSDSTAQAQPASDPPSPLSAISFWARPIDRDQTDMGRRPTTLAEALRGRSSVRLRESGDPGARAFLALSPVGVAAPEIYVDGVPTRSPADVLPSIYDQSYVPLRALRGSDSRWDVGGPFALHAEFDAALDGRTRLRSHFAATAHESYYRGLSWSTPYAPRTLRFEFEEWKTEEGYDSFSAPAMAPSRFGRAKQRRFEFIGQSLSSVGTLSLRFGRGRRYHDGRLRGATPEGGAVERWTGTLVAGVDRADSNSHTRVRLYHLDWQDADATHTGQRRDAVRLGIRARRSTQGGGWSWMLQAERQSSAFVDALGITARPGASYIGRLAAGHDSGRAWRRSVRVEVAASDAASQKADVGGAVAIGRELGTISLRAGLERRLRLPTLMETAGRWQTDFGDGMHRVMLGGGEMPIERQDRLSVEMSGMLQGFDWELSAEQWSLENGIGWTVLTDSLAQHVDGVELDMPLARLRVGRSFGRSHRGLVLDGQASHLLDAPRVDGARGAGWPRSWLGGSVTLWTRVIRDYNRLSLRYSVRFSGERLDDLLAPLAPSTVLPWETRHDLRFTLRIRDAELYFAWENVADATLQEVSATQLRARQRVWGLYWNFYN
jgi:hypothetical protein